MSDSVLKLIATRLNIPADEEAVSKRILAELDKGAEAEAKGADAATQLAALFSALGVTDVQGATQKIATLLTQASELLKAMPQLEGLKVDQAKAEDQSAESDVAEVQAAKNMPPEAAPALRAMRTGGITLVDDKGKYVATEADVQRRLAARESFRKAYPMPPAAERHLLTALAVQRPMASGLSSLQLSNDGRVVAAPPPPPGAGSPFVSLREIDSFDGRNITEKAMAFVRSKQPNLGHDDCHAQATVLLTQLR